MGIHRTPKSGLFLLELILAILFFSLTSAVCVNLFVEARATSTASSDLSRAMLAAQDAAEYVKAFDGDSAELAKRLSAECVGDRLTVFYDSKWEPADEKDQKYRMELLQSVEDGLLSADIRVVKGSEQIYQLTVKKYLKVR